MDRKLTTSGDIDLRVKRELEHIPTGSIQSTQRLFRANYERVRRCDLADDPGTPCGASLERAMERFNATLGRAVQRSPLLRLIAGSRPLTDELQYDHDYFFGSDALEQS